MSSRRLDRMAARVRESPFGRLTGHFLERMVAPSTGSEFDLGAGFLLGLLATPGTFYCFLLFQKYSSLLNWMRGRLHDDVYLTSIPDKFLLISMAMAITGIVTVLKWDKLLPDARDYLNLAPLPIAPLRILLANAAAVAAAVVILAVDVSAVPAVLFPTFVMASVRATPAAFVQFAAAHAGCVMLASVFAICGIFALLGALAAVLPRELFRACSSWVRGILLIALLMLLPTGFAGTSLLRTLERHPDSLLRFLPPLWYLGLYQTWQHRATAVQAQLGRTALAAIPAALALVAITYGLSYRRRFTAVPEGGQGRAEQRLFAVVLAVVDLFAHRAPGFERACHRFAVRALLRGEAQRLAITVAIGLGWLLAVPLPLMEAPLAAAFLLILGLRFAFEIPASVPANWIFRSILDARGTEAMPVVRRVVFSFLAPLVVLPYAVAAWSAWGFVTAVLSVLYLLALSATLIELEFAGYRKVPLTCPMPGFRDNLLMLCLIQFLGFELFTRGGSAMEGWMLAAPWRLALVPAAIAGVWYWNRQRIADAREAGELEEGVTFENLPVRAVERLNLSDT